MAMVIDEFGSAIGVITLEDVLEEVVGEAVKLGYKFEAHLPRHKGRIDALDGERYHIDRRALISDVAEALGASIASITVHTIGGLIMNRLRHLPGRGESIAISGYRFTLEAISEKGVTTIVAEPI